MDYETADGSQFSLREVWYDDEGERRLAYTSVTALVDGRAYAGKIEKAVDSIEEEELLACLQPFPPECLHPLFPAELTKVSNYDGSRHYLKAPSFVWEDCQPGNTFVADCLLSEATTLEELKKHPHPNLVVYYGCVVACDRITHLCLKRYGSSLGQYLGHHEGEPPHAEAYKILDGLEAGIRHLHSLGLAHNDINPDNICIDESGEAVILDFDSCLPFGERLRKGTAAFGSSTEETPLSHPRNDLEALKAIRRCILP